MTRRKHTTAWAKARARRATKRRIAQQGDPRNDRSKGDE